MKLEPQVERLYIELDRALDQFPAGSKFFSVRQIMTKFNCHRGVLDSVLNRMENEQLISRIPQVGIFSNVSRKPNAYRVLFAAPDHPSNLTQEWARCAGIYVENNPRWQLNKTLFEPHHDSLAGLRVSEYDALILLHDAERISTEEMLWLAQLHIPTVLLNADTGSFEISCVNSTDDISAQQACHYLVSRGHRHLAIVQSEPPHPIAERRIRNFCHSAQMLGAEVRIIDCHTTPDEYSRYRAYQGEKDYLAARNGVADFTAIYIISGESASGVMAALREYNYEIPDDVSILGHASTREGEFLHPPLTAVCFDLNSEVKAAFEGLAACLSGEQKFFHALVPTRIVERESVRNIS